MSADEPQPCGVCPACADPDSSATLRVGIEDGEVVIQFSRRLQWLSLSIDHALSLAELLTRHAKHLHEQEREARRRGAH